MNNYNITFTTDELSELYHLMRLGMAVLEQNNYVSDIEKTLYNSLREKIITQSNFKENFNTFMERLESKNDN